MEIELKTKILERVFVLTEYDIRLLVSRDLNFPRRGEIMSVEWDDGWNTDSCGDTERKRQPSVRVTVHEREIEEN